MNNKRIYIAFRPDMKELVVNGNKIATSRTKAYGNIGDWFEFSNKKFVLVSISKVALKYVADFKYMDEGFVSPEEFIKVWKEIHPYVGYEPNQQVWFHIFKEAK